MESMERFSFEIAESWEACRMLVEYYTDLDSNLTPYVTNWQNEKAKLLQAICPKTGRQVVPVNGHHLFVSTDDNIIVKVSDIIPELNQILTSLYDQGKVNAIATQVVAKMLPDFLKDRTITELADNKILEKVPDPRRDGKYLTDVRLGGYAKMWAETKAIDYITRVTSLEDAKSQTMVAIIADTLVVLLSRATSSLITTEYNIVVSVNPLDILLASIHTTGENGKGWYSCHNIESGQYATGPFAYLLDNTTAIAYAYTVEDNFSPLDLVLPRKIWRQMVFFDLNRGSAIMSREYPENKRNFGVTTRALVAKILSIHSNTEPNYKVSRLDGREEHEASYQYSPHMEWLYSDYQRLRHRVRLYTGCTPHIVSGSEIIYCVSCGEIRTQGKTASILCDTCSQDYVCTDCENEIAYSDIIMLGNSVYCSDCADNYQCCVLCNDWEHLDNLNETADGNVCRVCYDSYSICYQCGVHYRDHDLIPVHRRYFCCQACVEELDQCQRCRRPQLPEQEICWHCDQALENQQDDEQEEPHVIQVVREAV